MKRIWSDPRMWGHVLSILIGLLVAKVIWSGIAWRFLPTRGVDLVEKQEVKPLYYRIKLSNETVKRQPPKPTVKPKKGESIKNLKLLGIYRSKTQAVVTVQYRGKMKVLAKGERVGGFVFEDAGHDYAVFSKKGKRYTVTIEKQKQHTASDETSNKPAFRSGAQDGNTTETEKMTLSRNEVMDFVENPQQLYKNIGVRPNKTKGKIDGFRVTFIRKGTPLSKLGLRRGDILKEVNGRKLDSYGAALEIYQGIADIDEVTLKIQRGNKEMELNYEID